MIFFFLKWFCNGSGAARDRVGMSRLHEAFFCSLPYGANAHFKLLWTS